MEVKLFVGNLSASTTDAELKEHFSPFGALKECVVVRLMLELDAFLSLSRRRYFFPDIFSLQIHFNSIFSISRVFCLDRP